ncbi:hypothetical protein D3C87_1847420 [compost metagenome]
MLANGAFAGGADARNRKGPGGGPGKARPLAGIGHEAIENGLQAIVAGVMHMVGLGGGEQDAVDPAREGPQQGIGLALAEAG